MAVGILPGAPVTDTAPLGPHGPCRAQLLAECQAAGVRLGDAMRHSVDATYAFGAYRTLAWLCGHHEDRP